MESNQLGQAEQDIGKGLSQRDMLSDGKIVYAILDIWGQNGSLSTGKEDLPPHPRGYHGPKYKDIASPL